MDLEANFEDVICNFVKLQIIDDKSIINDKSIKFQNENKIKLKQLLDSSCSNKIHTKNIIKLETPKEAHMYCKYNNIQVQY